jgi:hypothetical protein
MNEPKSSHQSMIIVKSHHQLPAVTENEIRENGASVLRDADQGIQTAVVSEDRKTVRTVIGLNGFRYLPDPDPDPLEEIARLALDSARAERK